MAYHWSIHQLTEYLVKVSGTDDYGLAVQTALEEVAEALDAELGAILVEGMVRAKSGFGRQDVPPAFLCPEGDNDVVNVPGVGDVHVARGGLDKPGTGRAGNDGWMFVGRYGREFNAEELQLLQGMALALGLVLHNLQMLQAARSRHLLVETLLAIQKAISARRPLNELLDAITEGAWELLGRCPVALLLGDSSAPESLRPHSVDKFPGLDDAALAVARVALSLANEEIEPEPIPMLAAPVFVSGESAGCLIAKTLEQGSVRRDQRDLLTAFAQQVSLALTDARTVDEVRRASRDPITGLPNRALFLQHLEHERQSAIRGNFDLTVLFVDLDRFKAVNDTLGHSAGDELLAEVGRRISSCTRPADTTARLGGDEFAVALSGSNREAGREVATRIVRALGKPFLIAKREVLVGASVGIASLTGRHQDASAILGDADIAMYQAKRAGRGRCVVFEQHMQDEVVDRLELVTDLQHLGTNGQLWLAYQPVLALAPLEVRGVEALARWSHPTRGLVPPSLFIPLAEETDAIIELGEWVIWRALAEASTLANGTQLQVSLNISARQVVDASLPGIIRAALAASRFPAELLTLEITESLLIEDPELARARLSSLKEIGVRLAIDDFGTGYSSLSYLRQFPVDQVKIDRSFVAALSENAPDDIAIARSVIELCQRLRVETVAEGIETAEQLDLLTKLGCDLGQGYYFAAPMAIGDWQYFWENTTALGAPQPVAASKI